jgi:ABC-type oligopeptide transport system substrate-binding subunit
MFPLPAHVISRHGDAWTEPDHIVSNGPFYLQDWIPGKRITLVRNPRYVGRFRGNLTAVEFTLQDKWSPVDQLEAYRNESADIVELSQETVYARRQYPETYQQAEYARTVIVAFGAAQPPFHDRGVRRALSLAVDQDDVAKLTNPGLDVPATGGFLPPGFPGHAPGIGLPFDPEKARRLLAEAGFPEGKGFPQVELLTSESRVKHAELLRRSWEAQLGIQIDVNAMAWASLGENWREKHLFLVGWAAIYPDPDYFLRVGVHDLARWWKHPQYETLIQDAARFSDPRERLRLYRRADRILMEEAAIVPLVHSADHYLIKPWLTVDPTRFRFKDAILLPH